MENKYQEALENAKKCCCWCDEYCKTKIDEYNKNYEGFETLQELIDNYSKLEKALDKACEELSQKEKLLSSMNCSTSLPIDKCWSANEWKEDLLKRK